MNRVLVAFSLLLVAACSTSTTSSDGELVDVSEGAYSAAVDTEHPFDAATCSGDALTETEAHSFIQLAERAKSAYWVRRRRLVDGFDLWVRRRECDLGTGACGDWSEPTPQNVDFDGYRLDARLIGTEGPALFVEHFRSNQSMECSSYAACSFDGVCAPLAHANVVYNTSFSGRSYTSCSKSETESLTFAAHVTKSCARVTAERSFVEGGTRIEERFAAVARVNDPCSSRMHGNGTCTWNE